MIKFLELKNALNWQHWYFTKEYKKVRDRFHFTSLDVSKNLNDFGFPSTYCFTCFSANVSSCGGPSGRSEQTICRTLYTWRVLHQCVSGNGGWVRPNGRNASHTCPKNTCTASPLEIEQEKKINFYAFICLTHFAKRKILAFNYYIQLQTKIANVWRPSSTHKLFRGEDAVIGKSAMNVAIA